MEKILLEPMGITLIVITIILIWLVIANAFDNKKKIKNTSNAIDIKKKLCELEIRLNKNIALEKFSNGIGALVVVFGALVICFNFFSIYLNSEFDIPKDNMYIFSFIWQLFVSVATGSMLPDWFAIIVCAVFTILLATVVTVVSANLFKIKSNKINNLKFETLEEKQKVLDCVEELRKKLNSMTDERTISSCLFYISVVILFCVMMFKVDVNNIVGFILMVIVCIIATIVVGTPTFFIMRSIFFCFVSGFKDKDLRKEIERVETELVAEINKIEEELNRIEEEKRIIQKKIEKKEKEKQERINQEEKRKEREENLKKGKALYEEAISGDEPDLEKMSLAASLGNNEAAMIIAENLYLQSMSDRFTKDEKGKLLQRACGTLELLSKYDNHTDDSRVFCFVTQIQLEKIEMKNMRKTLEEVRRIQKRGRLSGKYNTMCDTLIPILVEGVDLYEKSRNDSENSYSYTQNYSSSKAVCSYLVGDRCAKYCEHYSSQDIKDLCPPCYHMFDPLACGDKNIKYV